MRSFLLLLVMVAFGAQAAPLKKIELSPEQSERIRKYHTDLNSQKRPLLEFQAPLRPFSEVEEAGYLFFSSEADFDSAQAKKIMASHLPAGVTLVIFTDPGEDKESILAGYRGLIDLSRVKVVEIPNANRGFWARDGLPIPVWSIEKTMELVDARYYHRFEPDQIMGRWFHSPVHQHRYYFEGGNFMVNDKGVCVTVDNDRSIAIPNSIFVDYYGCKNLIRLPYEKGIGHVDESVRFLTSDLVLTDSPSYGERLKQAGLDVRLLPRPDREMETYVNALLVNGTVYVPVYGEAHDQQALDVYQKAGLKVVPIDTNTLSNEGQGSLHCITMTYPKVPFQELLKSIGAQERF